MTDQLEIPQTLTIASALGKRRVRLSTLRPGDFVESIVGVKLLVTINSAKMQRVVLMWPGAVEHSYTYENFYAMKYTYLGKGRPRRWLRYLPRWIAKHFCPYTAPSTRK